MAETAKIGAGGSSTLAVIRTPVLKIEVVRWDWNKGSPRDREPIDITTAVTKFRWSKSTRNPSSGMELDMIPQFSDVHYLDSLNPMDVVRLYEFNRLSYQGFIRKISATGAISQTGTPSRFVHITVSSFGALLSEGQLGLNMFLKSGTFGTMGSTIKQFAGAISDMVKKGDPYSKLIQALVDEWLTFLEANGATKYRKYFDKWLNVTAGMQGKMIPGIPRDPFMFYNTDQTVTLWGIINKFIQAPFNEAWMDCGPRKVFMERDNTLSAPKPAEITLPDGYDCLIVRCPPFNGTVVKGKETKVWDSVPSKVIPLSYLTRFDLSKTMDESYSFYMVAPAAYRPSDLRMVAEGRYEFDMTAFEKYLYKPLTSDLFFATYIDPATTTESKKAATLMDDAMDKAKTLMNWNKNNDQFLSGSLTMMVPKDDALDPKIGEKVELEGIPGAFFYVEGVSHTWDYGGPLLSNVSVTRGYGRGEPIELKDRIFKRGKFLMGRDFA